MGLREQIDANYRDDFDLVANKPFDRSVQRQFPAAASGNGVCFTGEYYALLWATGGITDGDSTRFFKDINECFKPGSPGLLERSPGDPSDPEGPDDYYGLAAGCTAVDDPRLARAALWHGLKHLGWFGLQPIKPEDRFKLSSYEPLLWRQGQLLFALLCAGKVLRWWNRWLFFPLELWAALVIAFSCRNTPVNVWDSRRLSWLLIGATHRASGLCGLAAVAFWAPRLKRDYPRGMPDVWAGYFGPTYPFATITKS